MLGDATTTLTLPAGRLRIAIVCVVVSALVPTGCGPSGARPPAGTGSVARPAAAEAAATPPAAPPTRAARPAPSAPPAAEPAPPPEPRTDAPAATPPPTAAVLAEAETRCAAGDERGARALLAAHVEAFPGDTAVRRVLGFLALGAEDWAVADTNLSLVVQAEPSDGRAVLGAAIAKQWLTARGGARYTARELHRMYRDAARLLPEDDEPLRRLVGLTPDDRVRQVEALDEVLADAPSAVRARVRKGALLLTGDLPDVAGALAVLDEAARLAPGSAEVCAVRGQALAASGRAADAVADYTAALVAGGGDVRVLSNALDALLHPGDPKQPVPTDLRSAACEALCAANPTDPRFANNAGLWFRDEARDYAASVRWYERALAAAPDDVDLLNDTAFLYLHHLREWKDHALPLLERARRLVEEEGRSATRGYWDALENLCRYWFEVGRFEEVVRCADRRAATGNPYASKSAEDYRKKALERLAAAR